MINPKALCIFILLTSWHPRVAGQYDLRHDWLSLPATFKEIHVYVSIDSGARQPDVTVFGRSPRRLDSIQLYMGGDWWGTTSYSYREVPSGLEVRSWVYGHGPMADKHNQTYLYNPSGKMTRYIERDSLGHILTTKDYIYGRNSLQINERGDSASGRFTDSISFLYDRLGHILKKRDKIFDGPHDNIYEDIYTYENADGDSIVRRKSLENGMNKEICDSIFHPGSGMLQRVHISSWSNRGWIKTETRYAQKDSLGYLVCEERSPNAGWIKKTIRDRNGRLLGESERDGQNYDERRYLFDQAERIIQVIIRTREGDFSRDYTYSIEYR